MDDRKLDKRLGPLDLLTNRDFGSGESYCLYKVRDEIEKSFDGVMNTSGADKSRMQDREAILGHMFVQLAVLYAYSKILGLWREEN